MIQLELFIESVGLSEDFVRSLFIFIFFLLDIHFGVVIGVVCRDLLLGFLAVLLELNDLILYFLDQPIFRVDRFLQSFHFLSTFTWQSCLIDYLDRVPNCNRHRQIRNGLDIAYA